MNMVFLDTGTLNRKTSEMFIIYIDGAEEVEFQYLE